MPTNQNSRLFRSISAVHPDSSVASWSLIAAVTRLRAAPDDGPLFGLGVQAADVTQGDLRLPADHDGQGRDQALKRLLAQGAAERFAGLAPAIPPGGGCVAGRSALHRRDPFKIISMWVLGLCGLLPDRPIRLRQTPAQGPAPPQTSDPSLGARHRLRTNSIWVADSHPRRVDPTPPSARPSPTRTRSSRNPHQPHSPLRNDHEPQLRSITRLPGGWGHVREWKA
jgi:hypothetical protein